MRNARLFTLPRAAACGFAALLITFGMFDGRPARAAAAKPRLVVVVSIDQFPYEYIERMRGGFAEDGFFETVRRDGATYVAAHHGQAFTITGPGHSVLLTGAFPNTTGIIENDWFDRELNKTVYCVSDDSVETVGAPGKTSMSPRNLQVGTLGDQIKLASNGRGKVFGVALKDRASILMAGHAADAAFWFDANSAKWVTSTYYRDRLPVYLQAYNESGGPKKFGGEPWTLLLPEKKYEHYYPDDAPWETNVAVLGRAFPHLLPKGDDSGFAKLMPTSPYGSLLTLETARLVLIEEDLGGDEDPDLLCINLSSNDYVGHAYGPYSLEVQDITFRTDRMLGEFIEFLDERVGRGRWTLALSSDHGVAPIPEHAARLKLPARRVPSEHFATLRERMEAALCDEFGSLEEATAKYVQHLDSNTVYLNRKLEIWTNGQFAAAQRIVRDVLLQDDIVFAAYTRDELLAGGNNTELFRRITLSFQPQRSGDVLFVMKPYYIAGSTTATHGSPWDYDTHVPVLLLGAGISSGTFGRPVAPPQIAPTLARILEVDHPSGCTVEPLYEALGIDD